MKMTPDKITENNISDASDAAYKLYNCLEWLWDNAATGELTPEQAAEKWNEWFAEFNETIEKITK